MNEKRSVMILIVVFVLSLFLPAVLITGKATAADEASVVVAGLSREEALKLGEKMYRDGVLPSGGPMPALVQGDIPVDSTIFSCSSCHLRSGLGSIEGRVVTYPIDGITLFKPMTKAWNARWASGSRYYRSMTGELRSAYNDESLAMAIRGGVNPDGKALNYTMPRYPLNDKDMEIMIFYLKNLSVRPSPGVEGGTMRFATIVTDGASKDDVEAMMQPLTMMAGASRGGRLSKMARLSIAADPEDLMNKGFIKISVVRWDLKGPRKSWRSQLDAYYKNEPVFAIVGGLSNDGWAPMHEFCEENRIPCILPITDLPVVSSTDWYSMYFSKGLYQEGEAAARYLKGAEGISADIPVIEVFRDNERGRATAKGFDETWEEYNEKKIDKRMLPKDEPITEDFWKQLPASAKNTVILVWLEAKDLSDLSALANAPNRPAMVFLSSTLSGSEIYSVTEKLRKFTYIAYPYRLPENFELYQPQLPAQQGEYITLADYGAVRAKANFEVMLATKAIFMLKGYYNRDRFLEVMDMMLDERMVSLYPLLSYGPGQRYLSKGCYIVQLGEGPKPKVTAVSPWIIR